jgi:hypothetical protein
VGHAAATDTIELDDHGDAAAFGPNRSGRQLHVGTEQTRESLGLDGLPIFPGTYGQPSLYPESDFRATSTPSSSTQSSGVSTTPVSSDDASQQSTPSYLPIAARSTPEEDTASVINNVARGMCSKVWVVPKVSLPFLFPFSDIPPHKVAN